MPVACQKASERRGDAGGIGPPAGRRGQPSAIIMPEAEGHLAPSGGRHDDHRSTIPQCFRDSSFVAFSSPCKVSGYIRSANRSRIIWIECV
jgi:hypothetical protein